VLKLYIGQWYIKTLMLHKYSLGLRLSGTICGAINSIHSKSSLVYVQNTTGISTPAFVKNYLEMTILIKSHDDMPPYGATSKTLCHLTVPPPKL